MDLQRLETKVDNLSGEVEVLRESNKTLTEALLKSPFQGMDLNGILTAAAYIFSVNQPGQIADYQIYTRSKHAMRGIEALLTGNTDLLQDKPKKRGRAKAGASVTHVQPSISESAATAQAASIAADLASVKPALNPNG
jgi:hypothetical protein